MNNKSCSKIKKQIRTKRICLHPNPLFEKWLLEWKSEAEKRGSNMKYNFQKALKSLRRYPLPLHSGKECIVLAHFGDKICNLIDRKIEEYVEEHGSINWDDHIKVKDFRKCDKNPVKRRKKASETASKNKESTEVSRNRQSIGNCKRRSGGKRYIPAYRSGAYALLIALKKDADSSNSVGFLKKQPLMEAAQEFCDTSFTVPVEGSYYNAWSSMSTLIKKQLVVRTGSPSRYSLTEEGSALASLLLSTPTLPKPPSVSSDGEKSSQKVGSPSTSGRSPDEHIVHDISSSDDEGFERKESPNIDEEISIIDEEDDKGDDGPRKAKGAVISEEERSFMDENLVPVPAEKINGVSFVYVTEEGIETPLKEKALVSVDEERGSLLFLIKAKVIELLSSQLDYELEETRVAPPGYTYAFIADSCAPEFSTGLSQLDSVKGTAKGYERHTDGLPSSQQGTSRLQEKETDKPKSFSQASQSVTKRPGKRKQLEGPSVRKPRKKKESTKKDEVMTGESGTLLRLPGPPAQRLHDSSSVGFLKPGSFKVILCMDNTEAFGGPSSGKPNAKNVLKTELQRHGIDFDVRNLNVGDFLWICRGSDSNGQELELVLPFVIERKRMDDLSQSIRDGRFKEQKFRLKQSCLSHPIYLVEEFGSSYASMPLTTCEQAVTNTQVIDKFTVKYTKDLKESAAYLTIMTRYLQGKYKNKTLHCVPRDSPSLLKEDLSSPVQFLMNFKEFNSFSAKNRPICLQEMLAKHLLQISGASIDKVSSIIQKYTTPRSLIEALEATPSVLREKLLCDIKCQKSGRSLDQTISAQVARLYTWENLL